jgi:hypothetical protein
VAPGLRRRVDIRSRRAPDGMITSTDHIRLPDPAPGETPPEPSRRLWQASGVTDCRQFIHGCQNHPNYSFGTGIRRSPPK